MDIIDILIAKKKSFTGETESLVRQAQEAMAKANEVAAKIEQVDTILAAAEDAQTAAEEANTRAQEIAEQFDALAEDLDTAVQESASAVIDDKINAAITTINESLSTIDTNVQNAQTTATAAQTTANSAQITAGEAQTAAAEAVTEVEVIDNNTNAVKVKNLKTRKKGIQNSYNIMKNYTSTGVNEDGSMTQKAITDKFNEINTTINNINNNSGTTNLGPENQNKIVIVGTDGNIIPSYLTEEDIVNNLINGGTYQAINAVGISIDYINKATERTQLAIGLSQGDEFDQFEMYGGRKRCIVNRDGQILAWYGEEGYIEDGSAGQVMIYQPKFYYNRNIISLEDSARGKIVRKENLTISTTAQTGFKIHPLFVDENGEELDYVLLPAYESAYYDLSEDALVIDDGPNIDFTEDYLMSIAGTKPISGVNKALSISAAEQLANNIGEGWHITNMAAESVNQMLEMIEFGALNGQVALEEGIVYLPTNIGINGASITGSTSALGNKSGAAIKTMNEYNGIYTEYTEPGYRAISYRGFENPWGNIYRYIAGINLYGDGLSGSGIPYICTDFNYTPGTNGENYQSLRFQVSPSSGWVSGMGYRSDTFDWVYLPIEAEGATSLLPVGDFIWISKDLNGINTISIGGTQRQRDNCGLFYYMCDQAHNLYSSSQSARIMHIPNKNSLVYQANIASWDRIMGE